MRGDDRPHRRAPVIGEQRGERRVIFKKEAELPFTLLFYHTPNLKSPDSFALDLLSVVLAGGRSSRLYHELVYQKRLVRNVDADYSGVVIDPMGFSITAQLLPGVEPTNLEREIDRLVEKVKTELISDRELQKAKNQIEAAFVFAQDSIFGQAMKVETKIVQGGTPVTKFYWFANWVGLIKSMTDTGSVKSTTELLDYSFDSGGQTVRRKDRSTLVFVKESGTWKIAHEHLSPITLAEPGGAANGSQPAVPGTKRTSSAAGFHR